MPLFCILVATKRNDYEALTLSIRCPDHLFVQQKFGRYAGNRNPGFIFSTDCFN